MSTPPPAPAPSSALRLAQRDDGGGVVGHARLHPSGGPVSGLASPRLDTANRNY